MFSWFTCCQDWDILNPSISSLKISWVIFHLKLSFKDCRSHGVYQWSNFFIYPFRCDILSRLLVHINTILLPWVAICHLIIRDVFHKTISNLFFSLLVFQQLCSSICCNRALSRYCFPSFRRQCFVMSSSIFSSYHVLIQFFSFQPECCPNLVFLDPLP